MKTFVIPENTLGQTRRVYLDLGNVEVMASVRLNGKDMGTLWKPPFRIDITPSAKTGENRLEVEVVNLWPNRLIGDEQLPEDCDWVSADAMADSGLAKWPKWMQWPPDVHSNGFHSLSHLPSSGFPRPSGRQAFATWKHWHKNSPLLSSGLLGPVQVTFAERIRE
jgi:hypothetical protein